MPTLSHHAPAGLRLQCKYKGHSNRNTQIRASFSADGNSIICGSDDGYVYIWTLEDAAAAGKKVSVSPSLQMKMARGVEHVVTSVLLLHIKVYNFAICSKGLVAVQQGHSECCKLAV